MSDFTEDDWLNGPIPALIRHAYGLPSTPCESSLGRGRKHQLLAVALLNLDVEAMSVRVGNIVERLRDYADDPDDRYPSYFTLDRLEEAFRIFIRYAAGNDREADCTQAVRLITRGWDEFGMEAIEPPPVYSGWRALIHDVFGNPFRPVAFDPAWRTDTAIALARTMYELEFDIPDSPYWKQQDFSAMPILADALQDAGCDNEDILSHCRDADQQHVRGCWVVDLVLGKA